ncbi:TonB-dependent receptor [Altererythrobacter xixiisoli]|uniref:TonB-dependent receptor n=1 Tax=Croceibacterium xixiisoli TaxID=1476466 RepID=A0A6I4TPN0_9SPHN|nr:TonB-dependent receptor [Croceibacterium xixiisoli]MXO97776.1 TonB-dependent receptor [Croceibacterium xixiisoli]
MRVLRPGFVRPFLTAGVSLGTLALAAPLAAQEAPAEPVAAEAEAERPSNEIIVTAQFREQRLQDTPIAITAVNSEMLTARSQTDISQITAQAPNVSLKPQGAAFGPSLAASIRGVGQADFNPALEPGVGLYVDDVYYATLTGAIFDLLDLERVEVLRGPQGTLAGKNSIGGAVKLYSQRPQGNNTGSVAAAYGSRNRIDLRASADFGLTDNLAVRIAGVAKKQEGYVDRLDFGCVNPPGSALNPAVGGVQPQTSGDCRVARDGEVNYQAGRIQLRYQPTNTIDINLTGDYSHSDNTNAAGVLLLSNNNSPNIRTDSPAVPLDNRFICGRYCNYASYFSPEGTFTGGIADGTPMVQTRGDGRTKLDNWGIAANIDIDLTDDLQFQSITSYRDYRLQFNNDDDLSPLSHSNGFGDLTYWGFTQELRLNGAMLDNTLNWTIGGFYLDQRSVYATFQDLRYVPVYPLQFQGNDPVNADTIAAFANASWEFIDDLTVNAGIRYTKEHKDYTFARRNRDGTVNPFLGALDGESGAYDGDRVDYRLNLQYRWSEALMTYAQVSTGFKGGGINPRPFNPAQVQSFGAETLTAYEVGFKSNLFDNSVRLNGAAFFSDYKDIQLSLNSCPQFGGPGPCALPANAGDAHIKGFELETTIDPFDSGLLIDASVSYLDFQYQEINPGAGGPTGVQLSMISPYTAEWKWAIGVQYEVDLGNSGSLTPRFDANYQSDTFSNAVNGPNNLIDGYTLANARLTWRNADEDLSVSLEVTNLFKEYYFLTNFDLTGAGGGIVTGQPGRPREWALSVRKNF